MPKRSSQPERRKPTGAIVVATILVILLAVVAGVYRMSSASGSGNAASITLDPSLFTGEVHQATLIAQQHPELLAQLDCYCGCEQHEGHKNLLDCYRTNHATGCAICTGEAVMAGQLAESGTPVDQIHKILYQRYGHAHMHGG
jgi:hypothetical protein